MGSRLLKKNFFLKGHWHNTFYTASRYLVYPGTATYPHRRPILIFLFFFLNTKTLPGVPTSSGKRFSGNIIVAWGSLNCLSGQVHFSLLCAIFGAKSRGRVLKVSTLMRATEVNKSWMTHWSVTWRHILLVHRDAIRHESDETSQGKRLNHHVACCGWPPTVNWNCRQSALRLFRIANVTWPNPENNFDVNFSSERSLFLGAIS